MTIDFDVFKNIPKEFKNLEEMIREKTSNPELAKIVEKQKHAAVAIISALNDTTVRSRKHDKFFIAGGAPRDWFFGVPAKDLDIYVYLHPTWEIREHQIAEFIKSCVNKLSIHGMSVHDSQYSDKFVPTREGDTYLSDGDSYILHSCRMFVKTSRYEKTNLNLIFISMSICPPDVISMFDCDVSRFYVKFYLDCYDYESMNIITSNDVSENTIRFSDNCSDSYKAKILYRFSAVDHKTVGLEATNPLKMAVKEFDEQSIPF